MQNENLQVGISLLKMGKDVAFENYFPNFHVQNEYKMARLS